MLKITETKEQLYTRRAVLQSLSVELAVPPKEPPPPQPSPLNTPDKFSFVIVHDPEALSNYVTEWDQLATHALEANVFYESWMLLPAWRLLGAANDLQVALCFTEAGNGQKILCGLFPLVKERLYRRLPVSVFSLWRYPFCYLTTPLIHRDHARATLAAFFDWLAGNERHCPLLQCAWITGEGNFHQALVEHLHESKAATMITERFTRAFFRPADDAETYLRGALSRFRLKEYRRQERRLHETGQVAFRVLTPDSAVEPWIQEFLQFEAASWKGFAGRALASQANTRLYFEQIARAAFERGQLMMLALDFNGQPIAYKCNLLSPPGSFAFKIAFDEAFGKYSPGVLLELENIRQLHAQPSLNWMDSCASPDRFMINQLWPERRTIYSMLISYGNRGEFLLAVLPLLRWGLRQWQRRRPGNTV